MAILDIDEVIQIIRESDETAQAREKLKVVFDLTDTQANHILELRLRQLTKYSRLELEAERDTLQQEIAELQRILGSDAALRELVSEELAEVAERYGTDRRTQLKTKDEMQVAIEAVTAQSKAKKSLGLALEIADDPCWVLLSASGMMGRTPGKPIREALVDPGKRFKHDVFTSMCRPPRARDWCRDLRRTHGAPVRHGHCGAGRERRYPLHGIGGEGCRAGSARQG